MATVFADKFDDGTAQPATEAMAGSVAGKVAAPAETGGSAVSPLSGFMAKWGQTIVAPVLGILAFSIAGAVLFPDWGS